VREGDPIHGPVPPVTVALVGGPKLVFESPLVYTVRDGTLEVWETGGCTRFPLTSVLYWRSEHRQHEETRARPLADRPQA
jgi:hypothetical protein